MDIRLICITLSYKTFFFHIANSHFSRINCVFNKILYFIFYLYRIMFVSCTVHQDQIALSTFIVKADMDGTNSKPFVTSDIGYSSGITVDHGTDRVYWVDTKLFKIESIRLDGTDRRVSVFVSHFY